MNEVQPADFGKLDKQGVASAKLQEAKKVANTKADQSVTHTLLRKEKLPPTPAELKRTEKLKKEVVSEDSAWKDKTRIAKIKTTCTLYVNYFKEKYPEIGKFPKPAESAGLDDWQEYLRSLQGVLGGKKAEGRFDSMLTMVATGIVQANIAFPELFAGYNLAAPNNFAAQVASPQFLESIDDEKHEIIFTHQSWFQSGMWSRLLENLGKVGMGVALANKQAQAAAAAAPSNIERLTKLRKPADTPISEQQ